METTKVEIETLHEYLFSSGAKFESLRLSDVGWLLESFAE